MNETIQNSGTVMHFLVQNLKIKKTVNNYNTKILKFCGFTVHIGSYRYQVKNQYHIRGRSYGINYQWNLSITTSSGPAVLSFVGRLSSFRGDFQNL